MEQVQQPIISLKKLVKELLKKEIERLEAIYLKEIKEQYAAILPTIITDEQTASLETLGRLKTQLTNILI